MAMFSAKMTLSTAAVAMLLGTGALVVTAGTASAYVVCNNTKDCWHTDQKAEYPAKLKAQVHADDWYFHQTWSGQTDRNFRNYHEGNGYYLNGIWIEV
jgi:3-hydroxy-3-methylglutaryl CoA synthase